MRPTPDREEFDAMHDAAFNDFWDEWFDDACAQASTNEEVNEAHAKMMAAFAERHGE